MTKQAYMVIGCPGAGKSWICGQVQHHFTFVHHDLFIGMAGGAYVREIRKAAENAAKPLLIEAPFSISQIKDPLEESGFTVTPVVIIENPETIRARYQAREKKDIPKGHITRQNTYLERAIENGWFHGTSRQCLEQLMKFAAQHQ